MAFNSAYGGRTLWLFVVVSVDKVDRKVGRHNRKIENVYGKYIVYVSADYLGSNSGHIAEYDEQNKTDAHIFGGFCLVVLIDRKRPGTAKANQHGNLK